MGGAFALATSKTFFIWADREETAVRANFKSAMTTGSTPCMTLSTVDTVEKTGVTRKPGLCLGMPSRNVPRPFSCDSEAGPRICAST
mmetsp:Transcript_26758/g.48585  ORF Transcript_26758/g.48585 Transcript_26758/m.48585 type:complete len:87 (+) Transcript_26758:825-1085(+)